MELIRGVSKWGNSAGILLPKEWIGNQVKIILIDRTLEIKKEILDILSPYLEGILGIYLVGSYARGEQEKDSDIDIIAISKSTKKEIKSGKYEISIIPLEILKKTIKTNPLLILPKLNEAKVILNSSLIEELKLIKYNKKPFKRFIEETKRIIKINKGFIEIDRKQQREFLDSTSIVYSLILRLRGIFLIKNLISKNRYTKKRFFRWVKKEISDGEFEKAHTLYKDIKNNKKTRERVKVETAEKLITFLEKEVNNIK